MDSKRQNKIARLLQKDISDIFIQQRTKYSSNAMISVTKVNISPDLSLARINLSIFSPKENNNDILALIEADTKDIRLKLGIKIRHQLRIVPELRFHLDDSLDYIENIEKLLKS